MTLAYPDTDEQHPAYRCTHCPRLLHANELHRQACRVCEDRASDQLRAMPDLYKRLGDALTPSTGLSNAGPVSGATKTAPLPVALQPLSLRGPGGIVDALLGIEQRWRIQLDWDQLPHRGSYENTLKGCVPVLRNSISWICDRYDLVADDLKLINSLHQQADAVVNGTREAKVPVGCCPTRLENSPACGEQLRVSPWAPEIRCAGCGTRWARTEWLKLGATLRGLSAAA